MSDVGCRMSEGRERGKGQREGTEVGCRMSDVGGKGQREGREVGCRMSDVRGQMSEGRDRGKGQRSDVRGQMSEGRDRGKGQMSDVGGRMSDVRCQISDIGNIGHREYREGDESVTEQIKSAKDLRVYKRAYALSMEIFELSKAWPDEEKYSLMDQIRRASRSVCANLREAWLPAPFQPVGFQAGFRLVEPTARREGRAYSSERWRKR
jgi:hypothetical protein